VEQFVWFLKIKDQVIRELDYKAKAKKCKRKKKGTDTSHMLLELGGWLFRTCMRDHCGDRYIWYPRVHSWLHSVNLVVVGFVVYWEAAAMYYMMLNGVSLCVPDRNMLLVWVDTLVPLSVFPSVCVFGDVSTYGYVWSIFESWLHLCDPPLWVHMKSIKEIPRYRNANLEID
jgi:hypothetical protein